MIAIRREVWIVCALLLGLGAAVRLGQEGMARWEQWQSRQVQLTAKLARLQGWVVASPDVAAQVREVFGETPLSAGQIVERLSRQAEAVGARVTELRPRPDAIELGLEGTAASVAAYLQALAAHRPPLALQSVSLASQPKESAPVLLRVRVQEVR